MRFARAASFQIFAALCCLFTCQAATIVEWNTFGNTGTETSQPSVTNNAGVQASTLILGAGISGSANGNRFGGNNWFDTGNTAGGNTLTEAVAGNDFIEFTITPISGFQISLTSLIFGWERSATGPSSLTLRSSADNYVLNLGTITGLSVTQTPGNTLSISGLASFTTATTFRLYGYGATSTAGTGGFDTTANAVDAQLNGTVIPEPASGLMILCGLGVAVLSTRRR